MSDGKDLSVTYVIAQPCIGLKDGSCVEVCPVEAIFFEDDLPEEWTNFLLVNKQYFNK